MYGPLEGRMVPLSKCPLMIVLVSSCSAWDRGYIFVGSVVGAPGFRSIAWSHGRLGGNL